MSHSQSWFQHEGIEVSLTQDPRPKSPVEDLTFGAEYSDHMLLVNWTKIDGWDTPKIVPYGNLSLSPALSALHYSTEVYMHVALGTTWSNTFMHRALHG